MPSKDEVITKLKESVINQDCEAAKAAAKEALKAGIDAAEAIRDGLYAGLKEVCDEYEKTVFVAELIIASDAFYDGLKILKDKISDDQATEMKQGKAVLGVVEGDIHDLGKNMVKYLMEAAGIEIVDLGFDVTAERFIEEAAKADADLILISTMLTSLYPQIGKIVKLAKASLNSMVPMDGL
jgi:trimethylamine corrinoid protein